jgi:cytoplasmic iron level regulating protein YaaA (DUF328/UPF0246 family)
MEPAKGADFTQPEFLNRSKKLIETSRKFSVPELMDFMEISEKLAELNHQRFRDWTLPFTDRNAKQAVLAFTGDVYDGLEATTLKKRDLSFAQHHLRILSGLYGLLKPLDLIQPYRLEMGRPLATEHAKNLYEFWKTSVTEELNQTQGNVLINLASQEYFKAIDKRKLDKEIISPAFKDEKNGTFKIISFFAKKARGQMARYIIDNRLEDVAGIKKFKVDGYKYNKAESGAFDWVFTREE